jgi:NADPH-dependent curcumin reductase CurA
LRIPIHLLARQARAEAFLIRQFADRFGEGVAGMAHAIEAGRLLQGENIGKTLVQVAEGL